MVTVSIAEWSPEYGDPHQGESEGEESGARIVEHAQLESVDVPPCRLPLSFVDGVRQVEGLLYVTSNGQTWPGLAGVIAVGAVSAGRVMSVTHAEVQRLLVAPKPEEGLPGIPAQPGGWHWRWLETQERDPQGCSKDLQACMRASEARLASQLEGLVILDGPLHGEATASPNVVGYVKTQHRPLLAADQHARVAGLGFGQRSSLFTWADRFGCYLRMASRQDGQHPWFAVVRLEVTAHLGFEVAQQRLHEVAGTLPRFAGVPHVDPRAPQNLQAIAGLEKELRRRCGDRGLGLRAIRAALSGGKIR